MALLSLLLPGVFNLRNVQIKVMNAAVVTSQVLNLHVYLQVRIRSADFTSLTLTLTLLMCPDTTELKMFLQCSFTGNVLSDIPA